MYIPLQIVFHTGLRSSEVCGLTWDNIDLYNKTLTIDKILLTKKSDVSEFQSPKTKSSLRTIYIVGTLCNILKRNKVWQKENKLKYERFYTSSKDDFICLS